MFRLLILLVVALVIIVRQYRTIKVLKATLTEDIAMRNRWYTKYCDTQIKLASVEAKLEYRTSVHQGDRARATKQYRELKDAYLVLHNEKMESLLKR